MPTFRSGQPPKARFEPSRFHHVWQTIVTHLTPPSHPSTTSESAVGTSAYDPSGEFYSESLSAPVHLPLELLNPNAGVSGRHKPRRSVGERSGGKRKKGSIANSTSRYGDDDDVSANNDPVVHLVVDNDFDQFQPTLAKSDSGSTKTPGGTSDGGLGETDGDTKEEIDNDDRNDRSDGGSIRRDRRSNWIKRTIAWEWVVDRIWPNIKHFFDSSFPEYSKERSFQKEVKSPIAVETLISTGMVHSKARRDRICLFLRTFLDSDTRLNTYTIFPFQLLRIHRNRWSKFIPRTVTESV